MITELAPLKVLNWSFEIPATHWIVSSKSGAVYDVSLLQRQFGKSIVVATESAIKPSVFVALLWIVKHCFLLIVILTLDADTVHPCANNYTIFVVIHLLQ